jgi:hypothetical protein
VITSADLESGPGHGSAGAPALAGFPASGRDGALAAAEPRERGG